MLVMAAVLNSPWLGSISAIGPWWSPCEMSVQTISWLPGTSRPWP